MNLRNISEKIVEKSKRIIGAIFLGILINILTQLIIGNNNALIMWSVSIVGGFLIVALFIVSSIHSRWSPGLPIWNLKRRDRIRLYNKWAKLKAVQRVPRNAKAIPIEYQKQRQKILPINFNSINTLFSFLNMDHIKLNLPLSASEYNEIRDHFDSIANEAYQECKKLHRTRKSGELRRIYDLIYHDLSLGLEYDGKIYDIVVIPGARTALRAEKAKDLYHAGLINKIYLSGNFPAYILENDEEYQFLSEAEAMAIYLCDINENPVPREDIIFDKYARNTEENARYTVSTIKNLCNDVFHKKLDILLMTSPYHLKRFTLYFKWIQKRQLEFAINKIGGYITSTKYSKDNWFLTKEGFKTYLSEYWKIHGGRIIGEF